MKIIKKNYINIFKALCKHFGIRGFCIQIDNYTNNDDGYEHMLVGILDSLVGTIFSSDEGRIISLYLNGLINKCPISFKHGAILSFNDIAYWCCIKNFNEMMFNFTKEAVTNLCGKT